MANKNFKDWIETIILMGMILTMVVLTILGLKINSITWHYLFK